MKRPWMPLYVSDYLADTGHLTAAEHGAYLLLIMHLWANGTLPSSDSEKIRRITKMSKKEWNRSRATIQAFFFDGWRHERVEREMAIAQRISTAGSVAGKASAAARKAKAANGSATNEQRSLNGTGNDLPTKPGPKANDQSTSTVTVTDTKNKTMSAEFGSARGASALRIRIVKIYERFGLEPIPDTALADAWVAQGYNPDICAAVVESRL